MHPYIVKATNTIKNFSFTKEGTMKKKQKKHLSRRKRRRALLIRTAVIALLIPFLAASGILTYLYTHPRRSERFPSSGTN